MGNPEKFQLLFIGLKDDIKFCIDVNGIVIQMTHSVILLDVTVDSLLKPQLACTINLQKISNKIRAFSRIAPNLEYEKMLCYIILLYYPISIIVH